jgi:hypothetical protein
MPSSSSTRDRSGMRDPLPEDSLRARRRVCDEGLASSDHTGNARQNAGAGATWRQDDCWSGIMRSRGSERRVSRPCVLLPAPEPRAEQTGRRPARRPAQPRPFLPRKPSR